MLLGPQSLEPALSWEEVLEGATAIGEAAEGFEAGDALLLLLVL